MAERTARCKVVAVDGDFLVYRRHRPQATPVVTLGRLTMPVTDLQNLSASEGTLDLGAALIEVAEEGGAIERG